MSFFHWPVQKAANLKKGKRNGGCPSRILFLHLETLEDRTLLSQLFSALDPKVAANFANYQQKISALYSPTASTAVADVFSQGYDAAKAAGPLPNALSGPGATLLTTQQNYLSNWQASEAISTATVLPSAIELTSKNVGQLLDTATKKTVESPTVLFSAGMATLCWVVDGISLAAAPLATPALTPWCVGLTNGALLGFGSEYSVNFLSATTHQAIDNLSLSPKVSGSVHKLLSTVETGYDFYEFRGDLLNAQRFLSAPDIVERLYHSTEATSKFVGFVQSLKEYNQDLFRASDTATSNLVATTIQSEGVRYQIQAIGNAVLDIVKQRALTGAEREAVRTLFLDPDFSASFVGFTSEQAQQLLSAVGPLNQYVHVQDGLAIVLGTDSADTIDVYSAVDQTGQIEIRVNTSPAVVLPRSAMPQGVAVYARGGDDHVSIRFDMPSFVSGGAGGDTIIGGWGPDRIKGGPGNDDLRGRDGDDVIEGGNGDDQISGASGTNLLNGGPGANSVTDNHKLISITQAIQAQSLAPAPAAVVPAITNVSANPSPVPSNGSFTVGAIGATGNGGGLARFEVWRFGTGGQLLGVDDVGSDGWTVSVAASKLGGPGTYKIISRVIGTNGVPSNWVAHDVVVTTASARTPVITALDGVPDPVIQGHDVTLRASIDDPDSVVNFVQFLWDRDGSGSWTTGDGVLGNGSVISNGQSTFKLPVTEVYSVGTQHFLVRARFVDNTTWTDVKPGAVQVNAPPGSQPSIVSLTPSDTILTRGLTLSLTAGGVGGPDPITEVDFYQDSNGNGTLESNGGPSDDKHVGKDDNSSGGWKILFNTSDFPLGPVRFFAQPHDATKTGNYVSTVVRLTLPDSSPPTAMLTSAPNVTEPGGSVYAFTVTYTDDVAINSYYFVESAIHPEIRVQSTNLNLNYAEVATFVSVNVTGNTTPLTVTYSIVPRGVSWDSSDNDVYKVMTIDPGVADTNGNYVAPSIELGTFRVSIADSTPPVVTLNGLSTVVGSPTLKNTSTFVATGSASDPESGIVANGFHYFLSEFRNQVWSEPTDLGLSGSSTTLTSLHDSLYALTLQAENGAGTRASSPNGFFLVDTVLPTATIGSVSPNPRDTPVDQITIVFDEPVSGFDIADVQLQRNGANVGLTGVTLFSADNINWTLSNLAGPTGVPGTYTLVLTASNSGITDRAGNALFATASVSWSIQTPAPTIASFAPTSGPVGIQVTITGTNFTGANAVAFNGVATTNYVVNSATQITVTVPTGATTGPIGVATPGGVATSGVNFTVTTPPTAAIYYAPNVIAAGGTSYEFQVIYTDDIAVDISSLRSSNIFVDAPGTPNSGWTVTYVGVSDATNGTPRVATYNMYVPGGSWDAADNGVYTVRLMPYEVRDTGGNNAAAATLGTFTVAITTGAPTITTFSPTSGPVASQVVITGTNFTDIIFVTFTNNVSATFSVNSVTQITATVPANVTVGPIRVTTPGGTATSSADFVPAPTITSFTPTSGPVGTQVTITGTNFLSVSAVAFNGAATSNFTVNSPTQITVIVPAAATTGIIGVSTPGGVASSATNFTVTTVTPTPTTTTLTASPPSPLVFGQAVTFTATVAPTPPGSGTPTGTVALLDAATVLQTQNLPTSGTVSFTVSNLSLGDHTISAVYSGDANFVTGTSPALRYTVYPNPGTPPQSTGPAGQFPSGIAVGDFNGDGKLDTAVANYGPTGGNSVTVLFGNGDGSFKSPTTTIGFPSGNPFAIATGKFYDGSNVLSIVTGDFNGQSIHVILGNGDGTFKVPWVFPARDTAGVAHKIVAVAVGDLNGDNRQDIVASSGDGTYTVFLGNGDGTFITLATRSALTPIFGVAIANFDSGNGPRPGLVVGAFAANKIGVLAGNGDGTFQPPVFTLVGSADPVPITPEFLAVGDFNKDGKIDVAASNKDANSVSVLLGTGNGTFTSATMFPVGTTPLGIAVADINADGNLDVAAACLGNGSVSILLGNGNGSFAPVQAIAVGSFPIAVAIADFNSSVVALDLVVADFFGKPHDTVTLVSGSPVASPTVAGFTPTSSPVGTQVVITGTNFVNVSAVAFNGMATTNFTVNSTTQITVIVPAGAATGPIGVSTPGGVATSSSSFTVTSGPPAALAMPESRDVDDDDDLPMNPVFIEEDTASNLSIVDCAEELCFYDFDESDIAYIWSKELPAQSGLCDDMSAAEPKVGGDRHVPVPLTAMSIDQFFAYVAVVTIIVAGSGRRDIVRRRPHASASTPAHALRGGQFA